MNATKPDRTNFFANRFCRLMGKVCLGSTIGPEACWLLAFIVHTQDKIRYGRPVIFFNEDLATRTGFSVSAMRRARQRAVEAGWLEYTEGAKRRPASYRVLIPDWALDLHDGAGDEDPEELRDMADFLRQSDAESGEEAAGTRQERGRNAAGTRTTFYPTPTPTPSSCSEPGKAPASEPPVLTFPVVGKQASKEWHLTEAKLAEYRESFPGIDVLAQARAARQWCIDTPAKRKTPGGMARFLTGWFTRAQNSPSRNGSHDANGKPHVPQRPLLDAPNAAPMFGRKAVAP